MHQFELLLLSIFLLETFVLSFPSNSNNKELEISTDYKDEDFFDLLSIDNITSLTLNANKVGGNLRYTFGKRINNDRLVSQNIDKFYWPSPQNVTLILQYPGNGQQGAIVTFVEIIIDQSSNIGAAWVLAGGIGKREIASIVEGNSTYWFNYLASIYGI